MTGPKATALVCAFNAAETIGATIAALQCQTDKEFEVVVIDDASDDSTSEVLRGLVSDRVRVCRNESRRGIAASRNRGIAEARGEVLFIADADDTFPEARMRVQLDAFELSPGLSMVGGYAEAVDEDGSPLAVLRAPLRTPDARATRFHRTPLLHCTLAVKTEAVRSVGGYREKFVLGSDYDLLCRLIERFEGVTVPEVLCRYKIGRASSTVQFASASASCLRAAKRFARERQDSSRDSYEDWAGVPHADRGVNSRADSDYHLLAGKLAAGQGNSGLARRHFRAAGWRGMPYLGATLLGREGYHLLQSTFGSESP